ncbi:adaptor protein MecA [Bacillus horti]|uniref:Adapter protein MecA 1/2 n=1 Tax=Caldalkalibacillus horti TaxID=77523 RepID=A0ABT9W4S4_9BACI|nr:adaptor protein MecA [Bacillus horti]MDQ0168125.1 adapter protein MecA 1/2 [Bacillus horti]
MMNHDMYSSQLENRSFTPEHKLSQHKTVYHSSVYKFKDIENVIQLSHRLPQPFFNSKMVQFNKLYYLVVYYPEHRFIRNRDWVESLVLEYGERTPISVHRLEEYGKMIISDNALATIKHFFKQLV